MTETWLKSIGGKSDQDFTSWFTSYPKTHGRRGLTVEVVPRELYDDLLRMYRFDAAIPLAEVREAISETVEVIDWYRRNLEDVIDRRRVRGLAEAAAGYDRAMDRLRALVPQDVDKSDGSGEDTTT